MIRKILIITIFYLFITTSSYALMPTMLQIIGGDSGVSGGGGPVCTEYYDPSVTADTARPFGNNYSGVDYYGMKYIPTEDKCICGIKVNIYSITGTISSFNYYLTIFLLDEFDDAQSRVATSNVVTGISGTGYQTFLFDVCANTYLGYAYGFGVFVDNDDDLTDDPGVEGDAGNFPNFGDDNGGSPGGVHGGRWYSGWDTSLPYSSNNIDVTDGVDFVILTEEQP